MSCSVTERVTDNRGGVGGPTTTTSSTTSSSGATGVCRLRGTSNINITTSPNSRGGLSGPPQNGPQSGPQGTPLRPKPCCLWCCCCKCPCSNPNSRGGPEENGPSKSPNEKEKCQTNPPPTLEEIRSWGRSFDKLMRSPSGREVFRDFLRGEYSEENILFWLACEELKRETNPEAVEEKARIIYEDYISILSPKEVSLDSRVREIVNRNMVEPTPRTFDDAQLQIYTLMHRDSYPRFVNSPLYRNLSQQQATATSGAAVVTGSSGSERDQDG